MAAVRDMVNAFGSYASRCRWSAAAVFYIAGASPSGLGIRDMKLAYLLGAAALATMATSANAAVTISALPGSATYSGPTPTFDFESGTLPSIFSGGAVQSGSLASNWEAPLGTPSNENYWSVNTTNDPGLIDLTGYAALNSISFIWGSIDTYNTLRVIAKDGVTELGSWTGNQVEATAAGSTTIENQNPLVTLSFNDQAANIGWLEFTTDQEAFETDNFTINAVPEPGTWLMMLLGFGLLGGAIRSGKRQAAPRVRFAM